MAIGKISEAEMEVMQLFWRENKEMAATEVYELLNQKNNWKYSTIKTFLARLVKKGLLFCKRGKINSYYVLVTELEYKKYETKEFLDTVHNGSMRSMILSLCKQDISNKRLEELLKELEEKE